MLHGDNQFLPDSALVICSNFALLPFCSVCNVGMTGDNRATGEVILVVRYRTTDAAVQFLSAWVAPHALCMVNGQVQTIYLQVNWQEN